MRTGLWCLLPAHTPHSDTAAGRQPVVVAVLILVVDKTKSCEIELGRKALQVGAQPRDGGLAPHSVGSPARLSAGLNLRSTAGIPSDLPREWSLILNSICQADTVFLSPMTSPTFQLPLKVGRLWAGVRRSCMCWARQKAETVLVSGIDGDGDAPTRAPFQYLHRLVQQQTPRRREYRE